MGSTGDTDGREPGSKGESSGRKRTGLFRYLSLLGPGIVVAATGVGAGDVVAASVAGARYGTAILWAAVFGAVVKYALNEGIARWQLSTDSTLLEGTIRRLPKMVSGYFLVYLFIWSFLVAGALISACGLAAHAVVPGLSVAAWGIIHSVAAVVLVLVGRYSLMETLMKIFIGVMFVVVVACAVMVGPDIGEVLVSMVLPTIPEESGKFLLGVVGGVGGSVTLLSYGYWIREKGWTGKRAWNNVRFDLGAAYFLTGLFGVGLMIVAAEAHPGEMSGKHMALEIAHRLGEIIGPVGTWAFLIGFWGAVFSSLLGVWQGIPYLFADFMAVYRAHHADEPIPASEISTRSRPYIGYLLYLAFPPLLLLIFNKPVWIVVIYSIAGAFFMPFLAVLLLYMNNRSNWVGEMKNSPVINLLLVVSLILFGVLAATEIREIITKF